MNDYALAGNRPETQLITIHNPEDYDAMRTAGRLAAAILVAERDNPMDS